MVDVAAETKTPMISMAASARIVAPMDDKKRWVFKTPQNDQQMASAIVEHMVANNVKKVAFIGFADAYGEGWYEQFKKLAEAKGIKIAASERFNPADTSVTGQALKMMSAKPDAVFIAGSGTPAALPQKTLRERGYKGQDLPDPRRGQQRLPARLRQGLRGHAAARRSGAGGAQPARQQPGQGERAGLHGEVRGGHGAGSVSTFGAHAWDAGVMLQAAVPAALKKAKPGTAEFRTALRDALENMKEVAGAHGVFTMGPTTTSASTSARA
jgi:branched-chain amino acid transport system substrate-binding protein